MKEKTKNKTKNQQFTIPIREGFLAFVEEKFEGKTTLLHKNKKIKKDLFIYLIYYLIELTKEEGHAVHLNSKILRNNYLYDYKPYMTFIEDIGFIVHARNYAVGSHSNLYGLDNKYYDYERKSVRYKITDTSLLKKKSCDDTGLSEYHRERNNYCIQTRNHLVKHFDDNLEMDVKGANEAISSLDKAQYDANYRTIHEYDTKLWKYSIQKETDNRLHTVICRTNKKLLKFVTYNKQKLGEIDFKTCQPLFLFIILKSIFEDSMDNEVDKFLREKLGSELLEKIHKKGINKRELNNFGDIIVNKDLYQYIGEHIKTKESTNHRFYYIDKANQNWVKVYFETKRDLIKNVMMRSLYKGKGDEVEEVKKLFKSIFKIVKIINSHKRLSASDSNLSNILQNIEAYVVLDLIGKDISKSFKEIPLFSIHDSLITYINSIEDVKRFAESRFTHYIGIKGDKILKSESTQIKLNGFYN
jgi:hypothetical protein